MAGLVSAIVFFGNYIEFDPKLMIRFAPLKKQKKTLKTGKNI